MPVPLLALAMTAGAARAGIGAMQNRKETRRRRRLIQEAYRTSADRLADDQNDARQSGMESLAARGLLQGGNSERIDPSTELNSTDARVTRPEDFKAAGGRKLAGGKVGELQAQLEREGKVPSPIAAAMRSPTTLAGQTRSDMEDEMGLEWRELDSQRQQAEAGVSAAGQQQTASDISAGINTGVNVYGMGQTIRAGMASGQPSLDTLAGGEIPSVSQIPSAATAPRMSPIAAAMSGAEDASNWWGGIQGLSPLDAPGSSWSRGGNEGTLLGDGQANAAFNVGN